MAKKAKTKEIPGDKYAKYTVQPALPTGIYLLRKHASGGDFEVIEAQNILHFKTSAGLNKFIKENDLETFTSNNSIINSRLSPRTKHSDIFGGYIHFPLPGLLKLK